MTPIQWRTTWVRGLQRWAPGADPDPPTRMEINVPLWAQRAFPGWYAPPAQILPADIVAAGGTAYYVSNSGSDAAAGTSTGAPWKTVTKVNGASLNPGDGVFFRAGETFDDAKLTPTSFGVANHPIVFGSYANASDNDKRATLPLGSFMATGAHHLTMDYLRLREARGSNTSTGKVLIRHQNCQLGSYGTEYGFECANAADDQWQFVACEISNTRDSGMISWGSNLLVEGCTIHNTGTMWADAAYNFGLHGIYTKGPNATVQFCEIYDINDPDGQCVTTRYRNLLCQSNWFHDAFEGIGFYNEDATAPAGRLSVVRDNLMTKVQNGILMDPHGNGVEGMPENWAIYNNTIITAPRAGAGSGYTTPIRYYNNSVVGGAIKGTILRIHNNILLVGPGAASFSIIDYQASPALATFAESNNLAREMSVGAFWMDFNATGCGSLGAWVTASGQGSGDLTANPNLDSNSRPQAGSNVIDAGTATITGQTLTGGHLDQYPGTYWSTAPDIGSIEYVPAPFDMGTVPFTVSETATQATVAQDSGTCVFSINPTYPKIILGDSPDTYHRLDETGSGPFVDQVAAHNLTPNATIVSVAGLIPSDPASPATKLDHAGSYFKANSTYTVSQRPLTVEFWVTPQSLLGFGGTASVVASCSAIGTGWQAKYLATTGQWRFTTTGVADYDFTTAPAAQIGVKQHVVFVFKTDNSVDLYIDGVLKQNVAGPATINATAGFLALGDFQGGQYPQATIDELAVYKAALTGAQIAAHYAASMPSPAGSEVLRDAGTCTFSINPTYPSVVLADAPDVYYRLNETGAGPWVDSANGHNATPNGTIIPHESLLPADPDPDTTLDPASTAWRATTGYLLDNQPLTIEFWINPTSLAPVSPGYSVVVSCSNASNGWMVSYLQGNLGGWWRFTLPGVADYVFSSTAAPAAVGVLQHIVVVFKVGNTVDLYINGTLAQTISTGTKIAAAGGTLRIGQIATATTGQVSAALGELAIYKAALSAAQIAKHYAIGAVPSAQTIVDSGTCYVGVEVGDSTPVLDDFNKGAVSANVSARPGWSATALWSESTLKTNATPDAVVVQATGGFYGNQRSDPASVDQESWGTIGTPGSAQSWIFGTRSSGGSTPSDYELQVDQVGLAWSLDLYVAGAFQANLGSGTMPSFAAGDSFKLRSVGSKHTVLFKPAGGEWTVKGTFTEATITAAGVPTLQGRANTSIGSLTDFGGGGLATPAVESVTGGGISDSGTVTLVVAPSAAESIQDAGTQAAVVAPSGSDTLVQATTNTMTVAETASEQIQEPSTVTFVVSETGVEVWPSAGTCLVGVAQTATEALVDAGTQTFVVTESDTERDNDQGTISFSVSQTASEAITDSGTLTFAISQTETDTPLEAGLCTFSLTQSAAEQIQVAQTVTLAIVETDVETETDVSTVTFTVAPSGLETLADSGTCIVGISQTAAEATLTACLIVVDCTGSEKIQDAGTSLIVLAPTSSDAIVDTGFEHISIPYGDLYPGDLVNPGDIATPDYVHGFEALTDSGTAIIGVSNTAAETIKDSGTVTFVLLIEEVSLGSGTVLIGVDGSGTAQIQDAGTCTLAVAPSSVETLVEPGATQLVVLVPSGTGVAGEAQTQTVVVTPTGADTIVDAGTCALIISETDTESDNDQGTVTFVVAPTASVSLVDSGTVTLVVSQTYVGNVLEAATCVLSVAHTGAETMLDAGTATLVIVETDAETDTDAGTFSFVISPSCIQTLVDAGTASFVLSQSATENLIQADAGTTLVVVAPSGAETLQDAGTVTLIVSQTGSEIWPGSGTVTLSLTPSANTERLSEAATDSFSITQSALENLIQADSGTVTLSVTPTATQTINEPVAALTFAVTPTSAQTTTDAGLVTFTLTQSAQIVEVATATFSIDGISTSETVRDVGTVTFVVTPDHVYGWLDAGTVSFTLSQTYQTGGSGVQFFSIIGGSVATEQMKDAGTFVFAISERAATSSGIDISSGSPVSRDAGRRLRLRLDTARAHARQTQNSWRRDRDRSRA